MRGVCLLLTADCLLLTVNASPVWAESVGSPASILKKGQWVMGLMGGALTGRGFRGDAEATVASGAHVRGYGLTDRLSVYGKIGAAYLEVDDASILKTGDPDTSNSFGANVLTGAQVKVKFWESRSRRWEWDGSLQYLDLRGSRKGKNEARWHEVQGASSVAVALGRWTPYLGLTYSIVNMTYRVRENGALLKQGRYRQDHPVGIVYGTDIAFGESEAVVVNVEGGFSDGHEVAMTVAYTF